VLLSEYNDQQSIVLPMFKWYRGNTTEVARVQTGTHYLTMEVEYTYTVGSNTYTKPFSATITIVIN